MATLAPSPASVSAMARPMPRVPPKMTAFLPLRCRSIVMLLEYSSGALYGRSEVQGNVERGGRVGDGARGNVVDAGFRDTAHGFKRDVAGGFQHRAALGQPDRAPKIVQTHIVEQDGIDAKGEGLFELSERIGFDFDLGHVRKAGPRAAHRSEERRVGKECRSRWSP